MKTLKYKAIQNRIKKATGCDTFPEDKVYEIKPISWYLKKPWYGLQKLNWIEEGFDCDDFCVMLKAYWLKRHIKHTEGAWPALPVFPAKVDNGGDCPHWCMLVIAEEGEYFVERTSENIRFVQDVRKVYKVLGY